MTEEIIGDIFKASEEVVIHAISKSGKVDDSISKKFYKAYPKSKDAYDKFIENVRAGRMANRYKQAVQTSILKINDVGYTGYSYARIKYLAGILCRQTAQDTEIDMDAIREALWGLYETHVSFAVPYKFGMNISNAQWEKITHLLDVIYCDKLVTIYKPKTIK